MQEIYGKIMQEADGKISAIDLNGEHIIDDCKNLLVFLKEKLSELKFHVETHPFVSEAEEIAFFKYRKPALLGRLIYFYEILRIETRRPLDVEMLDEYYLRCQEEQKLFSTAMCRFTNITGAAYAIWIVIISCADDRKKASTWTYATSMKIRPFQPDTTASSPALRQWKCCMPF